MIRFVNRDLKESLAKVQLRKYDCLSHLLKYFFKVMQAVLVMRKMLVDGTVVLLHPVIGPQASVRILSSSYHWFDRACSGALVFVHNARVDELLSLF